MKLTCDRSALVDKLAILARGVSTRSALPVLSGVLLQASEGHLDLFSTDMELSIKASLATAIAIEREGEIVVPARLFTDVVRNLPGGEVVIEAAEAAVKVTAGRAEFALNAWSASDFPQTSTFDTSGAFAMGRDPFVETLTKVGRAASRDETRPILTGVLMTILGDTLKMVATDSYRLAVKETKLEKALETEVQAIVPVRALGEVARLAASMGEGDIEIAISENQALFKLGDPHVAGRVAELEERLVLADRDFDVALAHRHRQAGNLTQGPHRHDGLDLGLQGLLELRLFDGQPIAVGGHHLQRVAEDGHEHAGEDRPRLVAGGGAAHFGQRLDERISAHRERLARVERGGLRKVARRPGVESELGAAGGDLDGGFAGFDDDFSSGKVADHIREQAGGYDDLAFAFDGDGGGKAGFDGELHVGGEQVQTALGRLEQDAREHRQRAPRGHAAGEDREFVDQRRAITRELHPDSL